MLTDIHRNVLALLIAGQPLKTSEYYRRKEATIGPMSIPFTVVEDLERAKLIKVREVHHKGQQHGKHCEWEAIYHFPPNST